MKNVLHLGLSYSCNMNCNHCFVKKKKDVLNIEDYYSVIDDAYDLGAFFVYYTYGEPLLSDKLDNVSKYAMKKGFVQTLMSNGYFINDRTIQIIKNNKINKVCISLDSPIPEEHDNNRGIVGAYDKAINAIEMLIDEDINVGIATTISDFNMSKMNEIYDMALRLGVSYISFLRERMNNGLIKIANDNWNEYVTFFVNHLEEKNISIHYHDLELLNVLNEMNNKKIIDYKTYEKYHEMNQCHSRYTVSVEPNGDVHCCNLIHNTLGNVKEKRLIDIFAGDEKNENTICCCSIPR